MSSTHPTWDKLYNTARWRRLAKHQLRVHPLCVMCLQQGLPVPATVCDHVEPHKGDLFKFWYGARQSLCKPCHDGPKRYTDMHGYGVAIGADGWPLDKNHPVYTTQQASKHVGHSRQDND